MNNSEKKGEAYLISKGYTNIVFRIRETPDFTTDNGMFEIKRSSKNGHISFTHGQHDRICNFENVTILVFNDSSDDPIAEIPFDELRDRPKTWDGIKIAYEDAPLRMSTGSYVLTAKDLKDYGFAGVVKCIIAGIIIVIIRPGSSTKSVLQSLDHAKRDINIRSECGDDDLSVTDKKTKKSPKKE